MKRRPPVPKGFVEPNLAFWQELQRLLAYTAAGFKKFGIFKGELEEYGRLNIFKERVDFYTALAVKELQGTPLSEAEYENLRNWRLSHLARPFVEGVVLDGKRQAGRPDRGYSYRRLERVRFFMKPRGNPTSCWPWWAMRVKAA